MEGILLKETEADDTGNFQHQLLIVREYITSDQLYDFHKTAFCVQKSHDLISQVNKVFVDVLLIPGRQITEVFTVTGEPVDCREMAGIGKGFIQSPETADKTFGIHGYRLGEISTLRGNGADNGYASFCSI